jgi:uncharacterized protein YfaS (alpha-2-macroglobulin family)
MAHAFALAGMPMDPRQYGLRTHEAAVYREEIDRQMITMEHSDDSLRAIEADMERRLAAALGLMMSRPAESCAGELGEMAAVLPMWGMAYGALSARVPPGEEKRVDFVVGVQGEGQVRVRVTARGADSDAKELVFPVLVHGMEKTVSSTGSIAMGKGISEQSFDIEVPKERRPEQTKLTVRTSPSLSAAMTDALPYLLDYPYGCTELTLARFVPAVLTRRALQQAGGVKLEDLAAARTNLNAQQLTADGKVDKDRLAREAALQGRNPIYHTKVNEIIEVGLNRVRKMQHRDGGWGWWADDDSSVYMTAYVLNSLLDAKDADLAIDDDMLQRGRGALRNLVGAELYRWRKDRDWVSDADAFAALVMARFGDRNEEIQKMLYARRIQLLSYGKLLFARALHKLGDKKKAALLLENAEQNLKADRRTRPPGSKPAAKAGGIGGTTTSRPTPPMCAPSTRCAKATRARRRW